MRGIGDIVREISDKLDELRKLENELLEAARQLMDVQPLFLAGNMRFPRRAAIFNVSLLRSHVRLRVKNLSTKKYRNLSLIDVLRVYL